MVSVVSVVIIWSVVIIYLLLMHARIVIGTPAVNIAVIVLRTVGS